VTAFNEKKRIYLDHAATSYPKPPEVIQAVALYLSEIGASAGRGAYREAFQAKEILDETRSLIGRFFNAPDSERVVFTLNATDALNLALKGILKPEDHAVVSSIEHNSISRPLFALQERSDVSFTKVAVSLEGEVDFQTLEKAIRPNTRLISFVHGSNVSGTITPIAEIGERARRHGIPFLVDAAQTAGSYPIDVEAMKIDLLACPGHKGLLGPLGTGFLWARPGLDLKTLREGGTGSFSEEDRQPMAWPDVHESGSHNQVGIAGLKASLEYLAEQGIPRIRSRKEELLSQFLDGVRSVKGLRIIAPKEVKRNAGVVSLQFEGMHPNDAAARLDEQFRIQVRPGLHCAPWAHETFQTGSAGTVRFSFGSSNTPQEIQTAIDAVRSLTAS
jgi:cysteine desulfurase family protein